MLKGYLQENTAHEVAVRDLNIEWLHYMFEERSLRRIAEEIEREKARLESQAELSGMDQFAYLRLLHPIEVPSRAELAAAVVTLQSPDRFYDVDAYFDALAVLKRWERALSRVSYPGVFDKFSRYSFGPHLNPTSAADIVHEVGDAQLGFFESFLAERWIPDLLASPPDVIGVSIPFRFQLWHSMALVRAVRRALPRVKILAGGTALQLYKYSNLHGKPHGLYPVFSQFDAVIVGEGEEPLRLLLETWERGEQPAIRRGLDGSVKTSIPNVVVADPKTKKVAGPPEIHYHDLNRLAPPDYSDARWDLYLAPEPVVTYSPTRGCYWDRCVFCEIGLASDRPTSPSRERSYDLVIQDLLKLRRTARHVYWSVDAIRPGWMVEMSRRIAAANLDIRWGAEVRLDRKYSPEETRILRQGGCLAISVGMETSSDRLLDLMEKGTTAGRYRLILERLRESGIAVYPMTFIGFPTETIAEANGTLDFLQENEHLLAVLATPATFYLEGNAIITKRPQDFSLRRLERFKNLDAPNGWYWQGPITWAPEEQEGLMARLSEVSTQIMGFLDRPFLGGVDTPHSALYIDRHGLDAIKTAGKRFRERLEHETFMDTHYQVESPFDLEQIGRNIWRLIDLLDQDYEDLVCASGETIRPLTATLPAVPRREPRLQVYDADQLSPLDQWLDINFSRDRAREEPMYTQYRPAYAKVEAPPGAEAPTRADPPGRAAPPRLEIPHA
jgi:radical SAM superfamily enzyme YgiQ (UPF0313 family)